MQISLSGKTYGEPFKVAFTFTGSEDYALREDFKFLGDIVFEGIATLLEDESVSVFGELSFELSGRCDRCLKEAKSSTTVSISEDFYPAGTKDDEDYEYSGNIVCLSAMLRDSILNAYPSLMLCKEDCRGLLQNSDSKIKAESKSEKRNPFEILIQSGGDINGSSKEKNIKAED